MKRFNFCIVFTAAVGSLCFADVANIPAEDRKALQDSSRFHEVHSTTDLPSEIVTLCGAKLADPGGKWNATDSIIDPTLPAKRLIWAAIAGDYYVVHYERGGIAHTFRVLVAKWRRANRNRNWFGVPLEVRSRITQHSSMRCELASWMIAWITADSAG
jgi:hypothetical protein